MIKPNELIPWKYYEVCFQPGGLNEAATYLVQATSTNQVKAFFRNGEPTTQSGFIGNKAIIREITKAHATTGRESYDSNHQAKSLLQEGDFD